MPHLQRRTTFFLAALVALGQLAGASGFYWYQMAAISAATSPSPGAIVPEPGTASYSLSWAGVYLSSLLAGALLSLFAARGTKLWCATLLVVAVPLLPWALLLLASP